MTKIKNLFSILFVVFTFNLTMYRFDVFHDETIQRERWQPTEYDEECLVKVFNDTKPSYWDFDQQAYVRWHWEQWRPTGYLNDRFTIPECITRESRYELEECTFLGSTQMDMCYVSKTLSIEAIIMSVCISCILIVYLKKRENN